MQGFERFPALEVLWLNDNRLRSVCHLDTNVRMRELYVHRNAISTLAGSLQRFKFLQVLDASGNELAGLAGVVTLLSGLRFLRQLNLSGNPCCQEANYRRAVLAALPSLEILDSHAVTEQELRQVRETPSAPTTS